MSIGNFDETNESKNEVNETNETTDNTEKPRNQILETPDSYKDDFESKLDSKESKEAERTEQDNDSGEGKEEKGDGGKTSLLDKMRNLFKKKDDGENQEKAEGKASDGDSSPPDEYPDYTHPTEEVKPEMSFRDSLKTENWKKPEGDEREQKIEAFNAQMDDTVIAHGKMLNNRTDLSQEEKNEMQAEVTENSKRAKAEFAAEMYRDDEK